MSTIRRSQPAYYSTGGGVPAKKSTYLLQVSLSSPHTSHNIPASVTTTRICNQNNIPVAPTSMTLHDESYVGRVKGHPQAELIL
ncbi:hypothetical protein HanIR_Chr06g0279451 [Helianthus annuus]|nr:hypothetical protein HanIR_Chr06g0279451 [Helianthus annuus]